MHLLPARPAPGWATAPARRCRHQVWGAPCSGVARVSWAGFSGAARGAAAGLRRRRRCPPLPSTLHAPCAPSARLCPRQHVSLPSFSPDQGLNRGDKEAHRLAGARLGSRHDVAASQDLRGPRRAATQAPAAGVSVPPHTRATALAVPLTNGQGRDGAQHGASHQTAGSNASRKSADEVPPHRGQRCVLHLCEVRKAQHLYQRAL